MNRKLSVLWFFFTPLWVSAQNYNCDSLAQDSLTLLFAGDVMQHKAQLQSAYQADTGEYDYSDNFVEVEPLIQQADIAIANLETTLYQPPYTAWPRFNSPPALARQLQSSGFDLLALANNHSNDRHFAGVKSTLDHLDALGMLHMGTYRNSQERAQQHPLLIDKNNMRLAFFNYTFSTNGIASQFKDQVNRIDYAKIKQEVSKARQQKADFLIAYLHWGPEDTRKASNEQRRVAEYLRQLGFDLIIGAHPHVIQKMQRQKSLTVYSLGNFISNQRRLDNSGAVMLQVSLHKNKHQRWLGQAGYYLTWVQREQQGDQFQYRVLPAAKFEFAFDQMSSPQYAMLLQFIKRSRDFFTQVNQGVSEIRYHNASQSWQTEHCLPTLP